MNREASWKQELDIMYHGLASKGYIWMDQEEHKKVIAALEKNPDDFYLWSAKGILNFNYDWDEAIRCFNKCLAMQPFNAHMYYNRGRKYLSKNEIDHALADLTVAFALDPNCNWKAHYVGVALYLQRRFAEAAEYFKKAMQIAERHYGDLYCCEVDWLWTTYVHMGEMEKAKEIIATVDRSTPIVPVIGDDDGYKNVCLLLGGHMTVQGLLDTLGPQTEGGAVNELYGIAKYYYYVEKDLQKAVDYVHKTLTFTSKSGAWGYKMAEMDKEAWEAELAAAK